jgi:osmotically-inducible protein OsmY
MRRAIDVNGLTTSAFAEAVAITPPHQGRSPGTDPCAGTCSPQAANALLASIDSALRSDPFLDAGSLTVSIHDGMVMLRGRARSHAEKLAMQEAVRRVPGGGPLDVDIIVELPHEMQRPDAEIEAGVHSALRWEACLPDEAICVSVERGVVTLSGEVPWSFQKKLAEHAIALLPGITEIVNVLKVSDRQLQMEAIGGIHTALRHAADIEAEGIEVTVSEGTITLRGTVSSTAVKRVSCESIRSLNGVRGICDEIRVIEGK